MNIISVKIEEKHYPRLNKALGYLNLPLSSKAALELHLSDNKFVQILDSMSRLVLKQDGVYLEGDKYRVDELLSSPNEDLETFKKLKSNTSKLSLGVAAVAVILNYSAVSDTKYSTVDFCFMPEVLTKTPASKFCKSGEDIYRTHPSFLLEKDHKKVNPEFGFNSDKFQIPAKGRKEVAWNKATNPNYLMYSLAGVFFSISALTLYSRGLERYKLEFPKYYGAIKTYTLKEQLSSTQKQGIEILKTTTNTEYLNKQVVDNMLNTEIGFSTSPEKVAEKQLELQIQQTEQAKIQNELASRELDLKFAELEALTFEKLLAAKKHKKAIEDLDKPEGTKAKKKTKEDLKKEGEEIVKVVEKFDNSLVYVESKVAPSITRHLFKFKEAGKNQRIKNIQKLSEDLALHLHLEHSPRIVREKGNIVVEIPRIDRDFPSIQDYLSEFKKDKSDKDLKLLGGIDINGNLLWLNVSDSPDCHGLGAGATKSGKTQGIYALIASLVQMYSPEELQLAIYDGKNGLVLPEELKPWLFTRVHKATEGGKFISLIETERKERMNLRDGYVNIMEFNKDNQGEALPNLLVLMDEYSVDKEYFEEIVSGHSIMKNLAKLCRSEAIHLLPFDQSAKDENISNRVKENLAFRVVYRMVDENCANYLEVDGADKLLGKGDAIVKFEGIQHRVQIPNCSPEDLETICQARLKDLIV